MEFTKEEQEKIQVIAKAMWDAVPDNSKVLHVVCGVSAMMTSILAEHKEKCLEGLSVLATLIINNLQAHGINPFEQLEEQASNRFKMDKPEPKKWMN